MKAMDRLVQRTKRKVSNWKPTRGVSKTPEGILVNTGKYRDTKQRLKKYPERWEEYKEWLRTAPPPLPPAGGLTPSALSDRGFRPVASPDADTRCWQNAAGELVTLDLNTFLWNKKFKTSHDLLLKLTAEC